MKSIKVLAVGQLIFLSTDSQCPIDPGIEEFKFYAPGIGLIKDGVLEITEIN